MSDKPGRRQLTGDAALPYRYWDGVVDIELRADAYPYGGDQPGTGVQITLEQAGHTMAIRLPGPSAELLAQAVLDALGYEPCHRTRTIWRTA